MLELLSNPLDDDREVCSKEHQQLWEDALPYIKGLDLPSGVLTGKFDILFNHDLYGFLTYAKVPKYLLYPIMRLNGYHSNFEFEMGTRIDVFDLGTLEEIYMKLINDVVI